MEEQKMTSSKRTSFAFCETKQMEIFTITSNHTLSKKGFMWAHILMQLMKPQVICKTKNHNN